MKDMDIFWLRRCQGHPMRRQRQPCSPTLHLSHYFPTLCLRLQHPAGGLLRIPHPLLISIPTHKWRNRVQILCLTPPPSLPTRIKQFQQKAMLKSWMPWTQCVCKQLAVHQSWWHLGDSGPIFFPQWFFKYEFTSQQVLNCQEVTEIVHWNTNTSSTKYSCFMGTKFKLCCENWP